MGAPVYTLTDAGFQREMSYTLHLLHLHRHKYRKKTLLFLNPRPTHGVHKPIEYKSVYLIWAALTGVFNKTETQRWIKSRCSTDFFAIRQRFEWNWLAVARSQISQIILKACLHGGGGPQIGEVTHVAGHLSCKHDQIKMGDYMDRWATSPTWGPPPSCKQALKVWWKTLHSNKFFVKRGPPLISVQLLTFTPSKRFTIEMKW